MAANWVNCRNLLGNAKRHQASKVLYQLRILNVLLNRVTLIKLKELIDILIYVVSKVASNDLPELVELVLLLPDEIFRKPPRLSHRRLQPPPLRQRQFRLVRYPCLTEELLEFIQIVICVVQMRIKMLMLNPFTKLR